MMMKNRHPSIFTLDSFAPTIDMAAELMNVPADIIREWLIQNEFWLDEECHLSQEAIEFLAEKYIKRLHRYFDNCVSAGDDLDSKELERFTTFKKKYGKIYRIRIKKWSDIDIHRIARDFKNELKHKAFSAYFDEFEPFEFPTILLSEAVSIEIIARNKSRSNNSSLFTSISHSLHYGARIKKKVPARPRYRNIVLETLQENRFHIFSGESDSNALIDATLTLQVKQPQLAIATVFGYIRHKNKRFHETHNEIQAYCRS